LFWKLFLSRFDFIRELFFPGSTNKNNKGFRKPKREDLLNSDSNINKVAKKPTRID
jgi:hypothetical protein